MYFYLTLDLFDAIKLLSYEFFFCYVIQRKMIIVYAHVLSLINIYVSFLQNSFSYLT